jgi:hypothetical protein
MIMVVMRQGLQEMKPENKLTQPALDVHQGAWGW